MGYADQRYLDAWRVMGVFPRIHRAIFDLIWQQDRLRPRRPPVFADLCCSTGLLGQRLAEQILGARVVGIEADVDAVNRGTVAGITYPREILKITRETLPALGKILRRGVHAVVARRCIPEIFTADQTWGGEFVACLSEAGVAQLFLQGRVRGPRATHPVPDLDAEIALLPGVTVTARRGACALLELP